MYKAVEFIKRENTEHVKKLARYIFKAFKGQMRRLILIYYIILTHYYNNSNDFSFKKMDIVS